MESIAKDTLHEQEKLVVTQFDSNNPPIDIRGDVKINFLFFPIALVPHCR